ncbi:DUF2798 domain-containing protein [Lactococcus garvieae]|uniref:DUF2798 domain-containing protein n=1 Tax=Lactococcus garvieae DCC43 TaxID=1231377 RepID=K2NTA3_9LACT|nr:DUF2798 domain-containing protein [Lactococcus garvieae]EKF50823.1 hypothetical protein C426_1748 [Lactococcus garvieae DCC43]
MPKNFKEELVFTGLIAGMMVFVMTMYNVFKADGINTESWLNVAKGFPFALLVAVLLDLIIVGPVAKKIVFSYIKKNNLQPSPAQIGIFISVAMILGMVTFMSLFGILMEGLPETNGLLMLYGKTWLLNILFALPLQLLLVGPSSRFIFAKIYN